MNRPRTAIIIGGGIAGPAAAMALAKAGLEATVYEARPEGADGGGVMLTLAVNGIGALRTIDPGIAAAAIAAGFPTPQPTPASGWARPAPAARSPTAPPPTPSGAPTSTRPCTTRPWPGGSPYGTARS